MEINAFGAFLLVLGTLAFVAGLFFSIYFGTKFFCETLPRIRSDYKNFKEYVNRRLGYIEERLCKLELVEKKVND